MEPSPSTNRRRFLLGAGFGFGFGLPSGAHTLAGGGSPRPDDPDDMAATARLAGVAFDPEHCAQAKGRLAELRADYESLRRSDVPYELPPCSAFDPWPGGVARPAPTGPVDFPSLEHTVAPGDDADLAFAPILELASLLRQRKVTSRRLTELALQRLERFDPQLFCVVTLLRAEALRTADERDRELAAGTDRGPLHGIPYGAKDLFAWPGAPTTFGAGPFREHHWNTTATCLARLHDRGAVLVAKLSLGALAMGDLWHGGRTRNPWRPSEGSSGSSAGSASAVAAGLVPFALGTETLGSIVSPCRQCGVAGLRPTFGSISRHGAMPLSWTMDKIGPIARSAVDAAIVFDAVRGRDGLDPAARDTAFPFDPAAPITGLRVGIVRQRGFPGDGEQRAFVDWLTAAGLPPREVELPDAPYRSMLVMLHAESAAAFDDFARQGGLPQLPGQDDGDWPNQMRAARTIPAVEYLRASRLRRRLVHDFDRAMDGIDVLVAPTHGGSTLVATNLTGHPTYVLPIGADQRRSGRPTMLSLVGRLDGEAALLQLAAAWQNATRWHLARPELTR
jgi:Asp-tRNA(Asn)/Glu-tRNA(Gln) amidotransferase A subunit family amidase